MYRVLLADDQLDERETLAFLLKELSSDFVVTAAVNGKEALAYLKLEHYDLIITDVKMPFVNGLELAETIRQQDNQIPIIFVSGYGEFDFVKKALTLQAVDYLLKPINPDEFSALVTETIQKIDETRETIRQAEEVDQLIRQNTLHQVLNGITWQQLTETELEATLAFARKIKYLMILDIPSAEINQGKQNDHSLLSLIPAPFLLYERDQYVYFFTTDNLHQIKEYREKLETAARKNALKPVSYISKRINSLEEIHGQFLQLKEQLRLKFYARKQPSATPKNLIIDDPVEEIRWTNEFLQALKEDRLENAEDLSNQLFKDFEEAATASPSMVRFFFATLLQKAAEAIETDPIFLRKQTTAIINAQQLVEIKICLSNFLHQQSETLKFVAETKNDYVKTTKRYIANHFHEQLGLEDLARQVALSPKYLSEIFIQEEGVGITKYLKDFRIAKAKELLLNTPAKIKQISEDVGFNNYSYFVKIFRETVGMTPDHFRKFKGGRL